MSKKYYLVDDATSSKSDMDVEVFDTEKEALERAEYIWCHLTKREQEARDAFYVGVGDPDEEEDESGFLPDVGVDVVKEYK